MKITSSRLLIVLLVSVLLGSAFAFGSTTTITGNNVTSTGPYDPWADINDDGVINIKDATQIGFRWGSTGIPLEKAYLAYDSDWIDITNQAGQYMTITHNLGTMNGIVDITGKTTLDGGVHQRYLGGTDFVAGWNKTYGGTKNHDQDNSVIQTNDGGYALIGWTDSFGHGEGNDDFWLVKTDTDGNIEWNKTYGGVYADWGRCIVQTHDEGYAIAGWTSRTGGDFDLWLIKTDSFGNEQWNKTYGGTTQDCVSSIIQTDDGGYALAGYSGPWPTETDFWLIKIESHGNMEWSKTYGGTGLDVAGLVIQASDGGYILLGRTKSFGAGGGDGWIVKTDSAGSMQWNKTYGGTGEDSVFSVVQTIDGGYALAGYTGSFGAGSYDFWLVKTDSSWNVLWNKTYGGTGEDAAYSIFQTSDGGYTLAGYTNSFGAGGSEDFWLVKTDSNGNMEWNRTYGGTGREESASAVRTIDGGYALAGYTDSFGAGGNDFWLVKTDAAGNALDGFKYGLAWTESTTNTITLYRGTDDNYWNYVRVRIWKLKP